MGTQRRLSPRMEIAVFRVIQEAINNIIRHSRAHKGKIILSFGKENLKIKISDDGVGFNIQEVITPGRQTRGLGLLGMRERVELISGTLDIKSGQGQGTEITVEAPYELRSQGEKT